MIGLHPTTMALASAAALVLNLSVPASAQAPASGPTPSAQAQAPASAPAPSSVQAPAPAPDSKAAAITDASTATTSGDMPGPRARTAPPRKRVVVYRSHRRVVRRAPRPYYVYAPPYYERFVASHWPMIYVGVGY